MQDPNSYRRRTVALTLVIGILLLLGLGATTVQPIANPVGAPSTLLDAPELATRGADPPGKFYDPQPLPAGILPGTLVRQEPVEGAPPGIDVRRFVYVSQTAAGQEQEVSGLFAVRKGPMPGPNGRPLISVGHGTSGVAPGCSVSVAPFRKGGNGFFWWYFFVAPLVHAGYAVVMSDMANLGVPGVSDYLVERGAGADILNAARAAFELAPDVVDGSQVALVGHSQGGYNVLAAASMAPGYAPDIPIKGTVSMAPGLFPPAPLTQKLLESGPGGSIDAGAGFNAHLADAVESWSANFPDQIKKSDVYTPEGLVRLETAERDCILETQDALMEPYNDLVHPNITSNISNIFAENMPVSERFTQPILLQQGLDDTVVVPGVNIGFYRTQCDLGSDMEFDIYPTDVHSTVMLTGMPHALEWLDARFKGLPAPNNCQ